MFWVLVCEAVGGLSGWISREGLQIYLETAEKPPFTPPGILFAIVLDSDSKYREQGLLLFFTQLLANFLWSPVFFRFQAYGAALGLIAVIWLLILLMLVTFWQIDKKAAYSQISYFLWVTFATYLNAGVWFLNSEYQSFCTVGKLFSSKKNSFHKNIGGKRRVCRR